MDEQVETVIVGGGQAGLSASYYLSRKGREHVVLDRATEPASAWRDDRWDSFTLITPNWTFRLPGAEYDGPDPEGFMGQAEIIARFEAYIDRYHLPVRHGVEVTAVERVERGYRVETAEGVLNATNVVIATGLFQRPKLPPYHAALDPTIAQLHSGRYRRPDALPPGAVLVVGSGQSGCQITEELNRAGRKVYLCVGSGGRTPRRYRGKDVFDWLNRAGFFDRTADKLPSSAARFAANPQLTGRDGGHALNLHQFARDGVGLLGRLLNASGDTIRLAPDLHDNLARIDAFEQQVLRLIDDFMARTGIDVPSEQVPVLRDGYDVEQVAELDLQAAGVGTIIWAMGYEFDYSLVRLPVIDSDGFPIQQRGVTAFPGLYFLGMPWLHTQKSGLLLGVGEDAERVASAIAGR
jgi:putative flavoprotein involved in K+ transport